MSEQYSIYLHRRKLELVGTLWLNNTRGHISSAFTYFLGLYCGSQCCVEHTGGRACRHH